MPKIVYTDSLEGIGPEHLAGCTRTWPKPPSPATHRKSLAGMNALVLAVDQKSGSVVGYVCGMTDRTLVLYVWDLEIRPEHKGRGIEAELVHRLLAKQGDIYQVNVVANPQDRAFWERFGFVADAGRTLAMTKMRMDLQDGGPRAV